MFTGPVARRGLILGGLAIMARSKVSATLGVLVFRKVGIVPVPIRHFFNFIPLFAQHDKLLLRPFRGSFRFIDTRKSLTHVRYSTRW